MKRIWKPELFKTGAINYTRGLQNYKLVSYNILAQDLLVKHLYLYYGIEKRLLRWEYRLNNLKEEVSIIQPDILCLQEMQYDHLKDLVQKFNTTQYNQKFEYIFKKKTGFQTDGCIIIYDRNKFKLLSERCVEYYTHGVPSLNRENIGIMAKFRSIANNSEVFVVATTHLLYNPRREDVRISQINKFLQAIVKFSSIPHSSDRNHYVPFLLTGDFNFSPVTNAFQLLTNLSTSKVKDDESRNFDDPFLMESIDFGSNSGASTYHDQWIIVDYILKSSSIPNKKSIIINSTYKLPSIQQCWKIGKIPNELVGSDHFPLAIQFSIS